ncbi:MAG: hypothetical protein EZS28_025107, partial [Streblomastix strix]
GSKKNKNEDSWVIQWDQPQQDNNTGGGSWGEFKYSWEK